MRVHKSLEFAISQYTYIRFVKGLYSILIKLKKVLLNHRNSTTRVLSQAVFTDALLFVD